MSTENGRRVGWVGAGRMGHALAARLLAAGHDVAVFNRTRAKAESLESEGATVVDAPADLADREVVFTMVAGPDDFKEVVLGPSGVLAANGSAPSVIVDMTTVSPDATQAVRDEAAERGVALIAAPVSGNPKVVAAGRVTMVASGPQEAFDQVAPLLDLLGAGVTYVGDGEKARLVKICHNIMLGVVAQNMAEIVVLAEKGGMSRAAFLDFLNNSVMGSMFTRYKTPAYVNLDFTPTFTPLLELLGAGCTYVGDGENARLAKICHNLMLGVVAQCMAEITVLAEKGGMSRAAFLDFLNNSVMGSMFTRYKTPAYVNLDFTPTFTPILLRKDFDLGLAAARELDVPMPVAAAAQQVIQSLIGSGHVDEDFAALLEQQARASGLDLVSEDADIDEGLVVR